MIPLKGGKKMKKRRCKKVFWAIIIMIIGIGTLSRIYHMVKLQKEQKQLLEYGVGNQIKVSGKSINVYAMGNEKADETIVFLHGLGMGDTTVSARPMLENFVEDYKVFLIDRYGNGMSEDTGKKQDVYEIVEFYRTVLKKSKQEAPYILIAHSISGIYATYWAQHYPNEIQAIIYLDADPAECYVEQGKPDFMTLAFSRMECFASFLGLQRFIVSETGLLGDLDIQTFTDEQNRMRKLLMYQNSFSRSTLSELKLYYENAKTVVEGNTNLIIPQLYIAATDIEGEYYDEVYLKKLQKRFHEDQQKIEEKIEERRDIIQSKEQIMKKRGNIGVKEISGPHCLYEYAPEKTADAIRIFLENNKQRNE